MQQMVSKSKFTGRDILIKDPKLAAPNQNVRFVHFLEDISAPRTRINLSFAALEPWYQSNSFASIFRSDCLSCPVHKLEKIGFWILGGRLQAEGSKQKAANGRL